MRTIRWSTCRRTVRPSSRRIRSSPRERQMVPDNQSFLDGISQTNTASPLRKNLCFVCLSRACFCRCWLARTRPDKSGNTKSNRVRGLRLKRSSAGDVPVVECGVIRYVRRNREIRSSSGMDGAFLRYVLKVWTALSARVAGWHGAEVLCRIPLRRMKSSNSELVKTDPLSDTNSSGIP